jgi:large subunit ribosomal protein L3
MKIGLLGRKVGMTRVYDSNGKATPVTVIEAEGNSLVQVKTPEKEGYSAIQLGFETQKESRLNKAELGHFKKAGVEPKKLLREFRLADGAQVTGDVDLSVNQFQPGEFVDIIGR